MIKRQNRIKTRQWVLPSGYGWLETIFLFGDPESEKYGDYTLGFFHCKQCDEYQGFCFKLPPKYVCFKHTQGCFDETCDENRVPNKEPSREGHNARNAFWRKHHHGDGRIVLLEQDI